MLHRVATWANARQSSAATISGFFQQAASIGGAAVTIPVVISALGDKDAGVWFALQGVIAIFSLSDFGFSMAISRQVAYSFKSANAIAPSGTDLFHIGSGWNAVGTLYSASKTIFVRVVLAALVLFLLTYQFIVPFTHLLPQRSFETTIAWYLLALSFAFVFGTRLSQSFLDGLGYMYVGRFVSGLYQILVSLLSIVALRLDSGLGGLATGLLIASIAQFLTMHFALRGIANGRLTPQFGASRPLVGKLWRVSLPFGVVNTGGYLVGAVQIPLLGALLGPVVVAPIYIALRLSQALSSTILQIVIAQLPFFTQQCAQEHWVAARKRMLETLCAAGVMQLAAASLILFASPVLVEWWVGPGHYIEGAVLLMFSINYAVSALAGLPAQFVLAGGRNPFALSTLLHGVFTLLGMLWLCPRLGLIGAPMAALIAVLLTNAWLNAYQGWKTWIRLSQHANLASD